MSALVLDLQSSPSTTTPPSKKKQKKASKEAAFWVKLWSSIGDAMRAIGEFSSVGLSSQTNMSPKNFLYDPRLTGCTLLISVKLLLTPLSIRVGERRTKLTSKNFKILTLLLSRLAQSFSRGEWPRRLVMGWLAS